MCSKYRNKKSNNLFSKKGIIEMRKNKSRLERLLEKEFLPEYSEPAGWSLTSNEIYLCIHNDEKAAKQVFGWFNKAPEDSIIEITSKLYIANSLSEYNFPEVTNFLFRVAQSKIDKITIVQDDIENEWSDLLNKIFAAVYLVQRGDDRGKEILLALENNLTNEFIKTATNLLCVSNNKMGIDLYFYFLDKYNFIEPVAERLYFENKLNKSVNQVLNEYTHRAKGGFYFSARKFAMYSKKEFENLVELFRVMPEDSIPGIKEKFFIAEILAELGHKLEIDFLIRLIDGTLDKVAKTQSDINIIRMNKEDASILLVELENKVGREFFRNLVKKERGRSRRLVVNRLLRHGTTNSISFLIELSKEFPEAKEYCNGEFAKKIIAEVLGNANWLENKNKYK